MAYTRFGMCPFTVAQIGGGGSINGFGSESYVWTHQRCLEQACKLWVFKTNSAGEIYAQGCSMEFSNLSEKEIRENIKIKANLKNNFCQDCKYISVPMLGSPSCKKLEIKTTKDNWCVEFEKK